MEESLKEVLSRFPLERDKINTYSALAFAYIGDSVFDLIVRTMVVSRGNNRPNQYHKQATTYVNAAPQTQMMERMKPHLTEEEKMMFRRGKNAKPASCAKNQSHHDYRIATGFETLMGYLYMTGQMGRIIELVAIGLGEEDR